MTTQRDGSLTIKQGFFFPPGGLVIGIILSLFTISYILTQDLSITSFFVSFFVLLFGLTFFSFKTITLNKTTNKIIETTNCCGLKFNSQKDLDRYKYVTILRQLYGVRSRSVYSPDVKSTFYKFDVILLNHNHLSKQKINSFRSEKEAIILAKSISDYLIYEIVKFNPRGTKRRNNA